MRVLFEYERVVGSGQGGLEVAQGGVDGHERGMLGAERTAARDVLLPPWQYDLLHLPLRNQWATR